MSRFLRDIQSLAIAIGRQKSVIVDARIDDLAEHVLQLNDRRPVRKLGGTKTTAQSATTSATTEPQGILIFHLRSGCDFLE
jgi:hypothetical protein